VVVGITKHAVFARPGQLDRDAGDTGPTRCDRPVCIGIEPNEVADRPGAGVAKVRGIAVFTRGEGIGAGARGTCPVSVIGLHHAARQRRGVDHDGVFASRQVDNEIVAIGIGGRGVDNVIAATGCVIEAEPSDGDADVGNTDVAGTKSATVVDVPEDVVANTSGAGVRKVDVELVFVFSEPTGPGVISGPVRVPARRHP
jgi:hypothetical protein